MKKITREEAEEMSLKTGRSSPVRVALLQMKPGELLLLERKDVKARKGPGEMIARIMKGHPSLKFIWKTKVDRTGWVVERVK